MKKPWNTRSAGRLQVDKAREETFLAPSSLAAPTSNQIEKSQQAKPSSLFDMRNRWILISYLALFFSLVSVYDSYKENTLLVIAAAATILITGLLAWVWSIQPKKED